MNEPPTLVKVDCPKCIGCGKGGAITMPVGAYRRWKEGALLQNAWPEGTDAEREQLISGMHGSCFDELFKD
jgi:hypothetical protein